ncbi:hypothetical protein ECNE037_2048, partial [Escherichia coli NE037]
SVLPATEPSI